MTPPSRYINGRPAEPWVPNDLVRLVALNMVGLSLLLAAYVQVSGTASLSWQIGWTSLGIVGLVIGGFGNTLWLLAGRRAVGARQRRLVPDRPIHTAAAASQCNNCKGQREADSLVAGLKMTRYHRPDCVLVRGKDVQARSRADHERASCRPCQVCEP